MITALLPSDVAMVAGIEARQHLTPWHASSFEDALRSGWHARVLRETDQPDASVLGYFVAMTAGDDEELLTITVAPEYESRGYGRLFLEVRQSNRRAISFYRSAGFTMAGMRKNYYAIPADPIQNRAAGREDAVLMVRALQEPVS